MRHLCRKTLLKDVTVHLGKKGEGQHGRQNNEADNNKLYRNIPTEMG